MKYTLDKWGVLVYKEYMPRRTSDSSVPVAATKFPKECDGNFGRSDAAYPRQGIGARITWEV